MDSLSSGTLPPFQMFYLGSVQCQPSFQQECIAKTLGGGRKNISSSPMLSYYLIDQQALISWLAET